MAMETDLRHVGLSQHVLWYTRTNVLEKTTISIFHLKMEAAAVPEPRTLYRGADKSLPRPRRKQATATEDFEFPSASDRIEYQEHFLGVKAAGA